MKQISRVFLLILVVTATSRGQTFPAGHSSSTRWLIDTQIGTASGLGYRLPYIDFGFGVERPIGSRFEVQWRVAWSPTPKEATGDGKSLLLRATAIYWTRRLGFTANVRNSWLWTSQFDKHDVRYAPGVVTRFHWLDSGQRLYVDYLIPTGGYNQKNGIESSRLTGPEITWEAQISDYVRVTAHYGIYHYLTQGNPLCDGSLPGPVTCPRTGGWTGTATTGLRVTWPKSDARSAW